MPPFFRLGRSVFPDWNNTAFDLLVIGNGGPLILTCSNVHVSRGFSIFGNAFSTTFGVSHRFVTPIKGYRVMDSFVLLAGFEFSVDVYG